LAGILVFLLTISSVHAKPGKEANVLGDKVQQLMDLTTKRSVLRLVKSRVARLGEFSPIGGLLPLCIF
jgi:hypothetical protein